VKHNAPITPAQIEEGRKLVERVSELVGGREFVLILDSAEDGGAGDVYSRMSPGHDAITLLENSLKAMRERRYQ
jgi:hypothetical protein